MTAKCLQRLGGYEVIESPAEFVAGDEGTEEEVDEEEEELEGEENAEVGDESDAIKAKAAAKTMPLEKTEAEVQQKAVVASGPVRSVGEDEPPVAPKNEIVQGALAKLLTPQLAARIAERDPRGFLTVLNTNTECATLLWNQRTRVEVSNYVTVVSPYRTLICGQVLSYIEDVDSRLTKLDKRKSAAQAMKFESGEIAKELQVGNVYVRLFNTAAEGLEGTVGRPVEPVSFCSALLNFVKARASAAKDFVKDLRMVATAIVKLLRFHPALAPLFSYYMEPLLAVARLPPSTFVPNLILTALNRVISHADNRAALEGKANLTHCLHIARHGDSKCMVGALNLLSAAMAVSTEVTSSVYSIGGLVVMAEAFSAESTQDSDTDGLLLTGKAPENARVAAALALTKMMLDHVHGQRASLALRRIFPNPFLAAMKESSEKAVSMYDKNHENPELIWTAKAREETRLAIRELSADLETKQEQLQADVTKGWALADDFHVHLSDTEGEPFVGGVYLRLYLKDTNWNLHNPRDFMIALFDALFECIELRDFQASSRVASAAREANEKEMRLKLRGFKGDEDDYLTILASCICALTKAHSRLLNILSTLGYIKKIFEKLDESITTTALDKKAKNLLQTQLVRILYEIAESPSCVDAMGTCQSTPVLKDFLRSTPPCLPYALEAMKRMFNNVEGNRKLIAQAVENGLHEVLLDFIEAKYDSKVENPVSVKAYAADILTAMTDDPYVLRCSCTYVVPLTIDSF